MSLNINDKLQEFRQKGIIPDSFFNATPQEIAISEKTIFNKINEDSSFIEQNQKDRELNRSQRDKIAKNVFLMMTWEVVFTGVLLVLIIAIPVLNALAPKITINLPPLFFSISLILGYVFAYKYITLLPDIFITISKFRLKRLTIKVSEILKITVLLLIIVLINKEPRTTYIFNFNPIQLSDTIINLVLYTALAVIAKTTFLGAYIIKALYDLMKNHKLN